MWQSIFNTYPFHKIKKPPESQSGGKGLKVKYPFRLSPFHFGCDLKMKGLLKIVNKLLSHCVKLVPVFGKIGFCLVITNVAIILIIKRVLADSLGLHVLSFHTYKSPSKLHHQIV